MNKIKPLWTDVDFEDMNWHDVHIHGIGFELDNFKLLLDIDYIFEWIGPESDGYYRFLVAPCTLSFKNTYEVKIGLDMYNLHIEISSISRKKCESILHGHSTQQWNWIISAQEGDITFMATGFDMLIRGDPVISRSQNIPLIDRNGIIFVNK